MATIELGEGRPALSMDMPVLLACAFVEGPFVAGLVAFAGTFDQFEIRRQSSFSQIISNHGQTALSVMAAGLVFTLVGGLAEGLPIAVAGAVLALLIDVVVNYSCVALMQSLVTGRSVGDILAIMKIGSTGGFIVLYIAFGLLGLLMALAYQGFAFVGVFVCVAPLLLAREAFFKTLRVEQELSRVEAQALALSKVDARIADERHDERSKIAAALHDEILQCLYDVEIRAQVIREDLRRGRLLDLEDDVPALVRASQAAATELRDVIQGLRRSPIGRAGLTDTVALLANHLRDESNINFVLNLDSAMSATADVELVAYQILREAMTNAARHSGADTVWVSISYRVGELLLEVVDNGAGFDASSEQHGRHFGLALMKERAESAGGSLTISSQYRQGAVVAAHLPLRRLP
ncbi:MAG TPA: ATP-binding protein [Actinomycetota bacterium]|nr:ATP-binding protein [Actinomycetota bacterium]